MNPVCFRGGRDASKRRCLPTWTASESAAPTHLDRTRMLFPATAGARSNFAGAIQAKFIRDVIAWRKSVSRHIDIYRVARVGQLVT